MTPSSKPRFLAGEIVLVMFPFTDMVRAKRRPALILLNAGDDDILIARVTSAPAAGEVDVTLTAWSAAGLLLRSTVRLHKLATLETRLAELPRDHEIVAYCRGPYCVLSFEAVAALRSHGFNVRRFEDGFPEWKASGLPIEAAA